MEKIEIVIDNTKISLDKVLPFYQRKTFPGNCDYHLKIIFNNNASLKKVVNQYKLNDGEETKWDIFFLYLTSIWPEIENSNSVLYFINSVEKIIIGSTSIELHGAASTVMRDV